LIPELEPVWKRWEETHTALLEAIDALPADRWQWRPTPGATTAGEIIAHIARAEARYAAVIAAETLPEPRWQVHDREAARHAVGSAADAARTRVEQLAVADLTRPCAQHWHPLGPRVEGPLDVRWFIEQMVRHKAYHLGQLNYIDMQHAKGMPPMLKKLTPNLMVEDVNRTIDFYRDVLGFEVRATVPETGPLDWAMLARDGVTLMFQSRASLSQEIPALADTPIGGSLTLYTEVTGLQVLYEQLRSRIEVVQDLHETFYGTVEFSFRDVNGYIIYFSEAKDEA
jgi:uncharacterized glyoxalase superfamily protein PhnB